MMRRTPWRRGQASDDDLRRSQRRYRRSHSQNSKPTDRKHLRTVRSVLQAPAMRGRPTRRRNNQFPGRCKSSAGRRPWYQGQAGSHPITLTLQQRDFYPASISVQKLGRTIHILTGPQCRN